MAYSEFELADVVAKLGVSVADHPDLFPGVPGASLSPPVVGLLRLYFPLAIANGNERSVQLPNIPLFSEAGVTQFDLSAWAGLVAPSGTPKEIIDKLSAAAARAARSAPFREFAAISGSTAVGSTASEFDTFMKAERVRWYKVILDNGIKLE